MAEQSSTVAAFRALVMLVCLILIPVAAFCGSSFPAVLKALENGHWPTRADFCGPGGTPPSPSSPEAPLYKPQPPAAPAQTGSLGPMQQGNPAQSGVIAANYLAPIASPGRPLDSGIASISFPQSKDPPAILGGGLSPAAAERPMAGDPAGLGASQGTSADNQLKLIVERLQKLGATYFVLEPSGERKDMFRFYCKMSISGNPTVTKPFWSFDSDPLRAMTQVLKQVEEWQTRGG
jgi:hypothetical protein